VFKGLTVLQLPASWSHLRHYIISYINTL